MNTLDLLNKKIAVLPPEGLSQLLDYANYLSLKFEASEDEELLEKFLMLRTKQIENGDFIELKDVKTKLRQRYNKDV